MAHQPLQHYLRTYRRRSGFSQEEIARLLGSSSGTRVCRYENFKQHPSVRAIFAYEIIFNQPIQNLFAGNYQSVRRGVQARSKELMEALAENAADRRTARKIQVLRAVVESKPYLARRN